MSEFKNIAVTIHPAHEGDLLAKPPLMVNGQRFPYAFGKRTELPENVVIVAEGSDALRVERHDTTSPAVVTDGNGDGDAATSGGEGGVADSGEIKPKADPIVSDADPEQGEGEPAETPADPDPLDHDNDGEKGGSLPDDPPALSGMTREELEAQAEAEGVDVASIKGTGKDGNVLVGDIRKAIEAKRA